MDPENPIQGDPTPEVDAPTPEQSEAISNVLDDDAGADPTPAAEPSEPSAPEGQSEPEPSQEGDPAEPNGDPQDPDPQDPQDPDPADPTDPKEIARIKYEERQAYKAERDARIAQEAEKYVEAAGDDVNDQRLRTMEVENYKRAVEGNENNLITEFDRVKANPDLQMFNPDNKETFNQAAYNKALKDYHMGYLGYDELGNIVEVKGSLFEHFKETAAILGSAVKSGQVQQVRQTRQIRRTADSAPAASPKGGAKDPIMDALTAD